MYRLLLFTFLITLSTSSQAKVDCTSGSQILSMAQRLECARKQQRALVSEGRGARALDSFNELVQASLMSEMFLKNVLLFIKAKSFVLNISIHSLKIIRRVQTLEISQIALEILLRTRIVRSL